MRPLPRTDPRTPPCLTRGRYGFFSQCGQAPPPEGGGSVCEVNGRPPLYGGRTPPLPRREGRLLLRLGEGQRYPPLYGGRAAPLPSREGQL